MTTPAMQQYYDMKAEYQDAVLFFRMGDFYEMFDDDAHIAHKVLGIAITTRNKNAEKPTPLAGIPYHAKEKYLPQFIAAGYKVAIAEQVSDPKLKGIVKREVVRVVTPATLSLEGEGYDTSLDSNYIIYITESAGSYGISLLDIKTNDWKVGELANFEALKTEMYKFAPKEVVLSKHLFSHEQISDILAKKYALNIYYFDIPRKPRETLLAHFGVKNLSGFGIQGKVLSESAAAGLLEYLKMHQKEDMSFLQELSVLSFSDRMELDEATIRNLDLVYNFQTKSSTLGTLFGVLNQTKTPMGTRFLREQVVSPLQDIHEIHRRQDFVAAIFENKNLMDMIRDELKYIGDIDAILNRLAVNRALPRDLLNLKRSLQGIERVTEIIQEKGSEKLKKILRNT